MPTAQDLPTVRVSITTEDGTVLEHFKVRPVRPLMIPAPIQEDHQVITLAADVRDWIEMRYDSEGA